MSILATVLFALVAAGPRQQTLESRWGKVLGEGADQIPGVHFKQTEELHKQRDAAHLKVSLIEEVGGPRERALESKWGKVLGGGADQIPGVHFKATDTLHKQRDAAHMKVSLLEKNDPRQEKLENKYSKDLNGASAQIPGVHFKQTDTLHKQRDAARKNKVALLRKNKKNDPRQEKLENKYSKDLNGASAQIPGVHFKQTDTLHKQRDAARKTLTSRRHNKGPSATQVALLAKKNRGLTRGGPRENALESRWGKMLGSGADQIPGVHFKATDTLHKQRLAAQKH